MGRVLIIDDNRAICEILKLMVVKLDHEVQYCHTLREGLEDARNSDFDIIFLDVMLPDGNGLDYVLEFQNFPNAPEVIVITGENNSQSAEMAITSGAWDYLQKPLFPKQVQLTIKRVIEYREHTRKNRKPPRLLQRNRIIGSSKPLQAALERLAQATVHEANVLLQGETGTGKEVFARTLHENSERAAKPLVVVDCASLPEGLIESALFGHVKGSFTGADRNVDGLVKRADGGTLFLDEIGELCLTLQKSLLRVLQEKTFRPIGANTELQSDFRLIAATNRNLLTMVEEGTFREDLFFRLNSNVITIPPLREREDDIEALAINFIHSITQKYKVDVKGISPDYLEALKKYQWPGNIRELMNTIERSIIKSEGSPILYPKHLPHRVRIEVIGYQSEEHEHKYSVREDSTFIPELQENDELPSLREFRDAVLNRMEKEYLEQLMLRSGGIIKDALAIAGIGRTHLYNLLKKYNISKE